MPWNIVRDWQEEIIYHVLIDRFHDNSERLPVNTSERSRGGGSPSRLNQFCGGTIQGVANHLDYIQGLGCTSLWISPVFDTNRQNYHGYGIKNFLDIEPSFGTKEDLIQLVDKAHQRQMRVFLDIILNHSGDTWYYVGDDKPIYNKGQRYLFGGWRDSKYPIPVELRNPNYYHRMGRIQDEGSHWDDPKEGRYGDFMELKDFMNDESPDGLELQEILINIYCFWIHQTDIDGFRLDAVKHVPPRTVSRFCTRIREYAKSIGKRGFFLFGEMMAGEYKDMNDYTGPNYTVEDVNGEIYFGLDSVLDFPLYYVLNETIKGTKSPKHLYSRYNKMWQSELERGIHGQHLVTFLDNHDLGTNKWITDSRYPYSGQEVQVKERFAADAHDRQVIAGIGYLLCAVGTPCIYYGTEQGFSGHTGEEPSGDSLIRETMFDLDHGHSNYLNKNCSIYQNIRAIAELRNKLPVLKYGRMYFRETSKDAINFGFTSECPFTLAFSRILAQKEILVAYNSAPNEHREDCIIVSSELNQKGDRMNFLYGAEGEVEIYESETECYTLMGKRALFVRLSLKPMQFVILGQISTD